MQALLILFTGLVVSLPVQAQVEAWVENGTEVGARESISRSVALLKAPRHSCTATFISEITLLTAGHCDHGDLPSSVKVRVRGANGQVYEEFAKKIIRHPDYRIETVGGSNLVANDFALIKLKRKLPIKVRPVQLVDPRSIVGEFDVLVMGYGLRAKGRTSTVLRRGRMTAKVEPILGFYGEIGLAMVPADVNANATCPGDSGGPVFYEDRGMRSLIGVHSLSSGCQGGGPDEVHSLSALPVLVTAWIWANYE